MGVIGYKTTATHEEMKMNFIKAFFFFSCLVIFQIMLNLYIVFLKMLLTIKWLLCNIFRVILDDILKKTIGSQSMFIAHS